MTGNSPLRFTDLWRWSGTISAGRYAGLALSLFALKFALDRLLTTVVFSRSWGIHNYFLPAEFRWGHAEDRRFYLSMLLLALPFAWIGSALTVRRLRALRMPVWLVGLFLIPAVNIILFALLCVIPSQPETDETEATLPAPPEGRPPVELGELAPATPLEYAPAGQAVHVSSHRSTCLVFVLGVAIAVATGLTMIEMLNSYGWVLFIGLPFAISIITIAIYSLEDQARFGTALLIANGSLLSWASLLLLLGFEGVICLVMAAPLIVSGATLGGIVGWFIGRSVSCRPFWTRSLLLPILLPPLAALESAARDQAGLFAVTTGVEVAAPAGVVWRNVIDFSDLPPPSELVFKAGIAYPTHATITGSGVGAVRECVFSTGTFVEPIQVWDEPRLLQFTVTEQPQPMRELSFHDHVHPPHLDNFLVSRKGQFRLVRLDDGRTRLEGTTWYQHHIWPESYWRLWSDHLIHTIHRRVLDHIRDLSERETAIAATGTEGDYR